ncbi:MAG: HAMP domain-containing sensor histidine kinase [Phycisphaerae bacterium]|nr:HAMP domain-containing sensor histidine kinase [Phycisphaerae bacterium]
MAKFDGKPFVTAQLDEALPDWKLELYFENDQIFAGAAKRQESVYLWTAVLVVALILASGGVAVQAVGRQIRLNKLKNDFIATVTHELKTPLASMRVLVDTLLEGRCESGQQETEYLTLVAKENQRLSRLIDNFLTFSRMERNKQAFEFAPAGPKEIAENAAEAVRAKFLQKNCKFSVTVGDGLASINADKDAMVTVLVNLLDNACKYSGDDKKIELSVFSEDGYVCLAIKDNGIGMTRRQLKRAFDRFYQVDSSLARRAEGCGLGLAIVKFIVDAHKGRIEVDSKIGKGSIFTVKIPITKAGWRDPLLSTIFFFLSLFVAAAK